MDQQDGALLGSTRTSPLIGGLILLTGLAVYCLLVVYGAANGPRGSDQFWYIADIESLLAGRGAYSNLVFANGLLTDGYAGPRPFIHNILYPYLSALPAGLLGPFAGSIAVNIACHLFAALVLFWVARKLGVDGVFAALISVAYLFFPLNYWLSVNVLAESSTVPFIALMGAAMVTDYRKAWPWFAVAVLVGLLIFARPSAAFFVVMLPLAFVFSNRPLSGRSLALGAGLFAVIMGFYWFWGTFFEYNSPCPIKDRFNIKIPGETSNMYCLFRLPDEPLMFYGWITKVFHNLERQLGFSDLLSFLFYWPVNLLLVASAICIALVKDTRVRALCWLSLGFGVVQFATLSLTQNQFRYLVLQIPLGILALGLLFAFGRVEILHRFRVPLFAVAIVAMAAADFQFAQRARADSMELAPEMTALIAELDARLPGDRHVMLESTEKTEGIELAIQIDYALSPRPTLMLPDSYPDEVYDELLDIFRPEAAILLRDSYLHDLLTDRLRAEEIRLPARYAGYSLYLFEQPAASAAAAR